MEAVIEYPKVSEELIDDLYDDLDDIVERTQMVIENQFDVRDGVIFFGNADEEDYLEAIVADPKAIVPFFQKITGLPNREFERITGESINGMKDLSPKSLRTHKKTRIFINEIMEWVPTELELNLALYTFVKMWEKDQRRHYRAKFEADVRQILRQGGYPNRKGGNLKGKPDFVIPPKLEGPFSVIGEVRATHPTDAQKRVKEFLSEQKEAGRNHEGSKFVAVIKLPSRISNLQHHRQKIMDACEGDLDAVIFDDEFDDLFKIFEEWGLDRQSSIQEYNN